MIQPNSLNKEFDKYDSQYENSDYLKSIVSIHTDTKSQDICIRRTNKRENEQYYKWKLIYALVFSGMYPKENIGTEVHFPKGNKVGELLVKMYAGTPKRVIDGTWICSLTKRKDNLLMWSYYNKHEGICIGLNIEKVKISLSKYDGIPIGCPEIEVQYQNIIEKPDFFRNMNKQDFLHYQIGTKAKAWEHEEEVRLYMRGNMLLNVINFNKEPYFLEINGECFETLYLGVRIEDKNKNEIVNAARKLNPNILIYQMATDTVAFKLNTEAI